MIGVPGQNKLQVSGEFMGTMKVGEEESKQPILRGKGSPKSLCLDCLPLKPSKLLARVGAVQSGVCPRQEFPELFEGVGQALTRVHDTTKTRSKAFRILMTPQRVPIPLLPSVKKELKRMEDLGGDI